MSGYRLVTWVGCLCAVAFGLVPNANGATRDLCPAPVSDCNSNGIEDSFELDCNSNGLPDSCEQLDDCNANQVADICEPPASRVRANLAGFVACLAGPAQTPVANSPDGCPCEPFFDLDGDSDVDLADFAMLQQDGPPIPIRWWAPRWRFRVRVTVGAAGYLRTDMPAEVPMNFTAALNQVQSAVPFAPATLRVIELDAQNAVIDESVPFQFDPAPEFDASTNAIGTLVVLLVGATPADATRTYEVYFAPPAAGLPAACFEPLVQASEAGVHEGQDSYRIDTAIGAWYYHKVGAGFASLDDIDGDDWIGHHPTGGSAGNYRGIPNAGPFHPGEPLCASTLESNGPLRARIRSTSIDGLWESTWDIYPRYATMTMLRIAEPYWILYEGTPAGNLDYNTDYVVRSTGQQTPVSVTWAEDIPAPEWVYFGDAATDRMLYVAHHGDDLESDQFWQMQRNMTVFGFGRQQPCCDAYLTTVPDRFTYGLAEVQSFAEAAQLIEGVWRELDVTVSPAEAYPIP